MRNARRNGVGIMAAEWRLLHDGIHEARHHFAVEEALARLLDEGHSPPTLRMRQVHPAVFVGVYQNTWSEVDVAYCQTQDIQIVRRANGGGAVYHEMGSFCFSAFFRRDVFPQSEEELYRLFATPAIRTCADYGVVAHFHGRNDVLVGERKIYGSAQLAWYDAFVQSGTFLVNMNFDVMERALTPPALKFAGKSARSIRERVTSLSREVGRELETREVMGRFVDHAADVLGIQLVLGDLTLEEQALAAELLAVKYSTDEWNFGSRPEYQVTVADRTEEGVISLSADMEDETIRKARVTGDMLLSDRCELENLEHSLTGCSLQEAQTAVQTALLSAGIREALFRLLAKLAKEVTAISSSSTEIET
jgi:lipoate---protein ligase